LAEAVLERAPNQDLPARLTARWAAGPKQPDLARLALPLWQMAGPGKINRAGEQGARYLALTWENAQTRCTLSLPASEDETSSLELADRTAPQDLPARAERVRQRELAERRDRLVHGKPQVRLTRELEQVKLGQARAEVLAVLSAEETTVKREFPGGILATF